MKFLIQTKGKQEDNELQNHGLAMVNLSPLLYPGVTSVKGPFAVQPYTDQAMLASGFSASVAEEMHRSGSTLQVDQRLKSSVSYFIKHLIKILILSFIYNNK